MADEEPQIDAPAGWVEALLQSKADLATGRSVPLLPVLEELRAQAERLERILGTEPDEPQFIARR